MRCSLRSAPVRTRSCATPRSPLTAGASASAARRADPLLKAVKHKNPVTQFLAAEGLARGGRAEGMQVLLSGIEYLEDTSPPRPCGAGARRTRRPAVGGQTARARDRGRQPAARSGDRSGRPPEEVAAGRRRVPLVGEAREGAEQHRAARARRAAVLRHAERVGHRPREGEREGLRLVALAASRDRGGATRLQRRPRDTRPTAQGASHQHRLRTRDGRVQERPPLVGQGVARTELQPDPEPERGFVRGQHRRGRRRASNPSSRTATRSASWNCSRTARRRFRSSWSRRC